MTTTLETRLRGWGRRAALGARRWLARSTSGSPPRSAERALRLYRLDTREAYREHVALLGADSWELERALADAHPDVAFKVPGRCWVDAMPVDFEMDYLYAQDLGERRIPNWRERMTCPVCRLNNRQRAALHVASESLGLHAGSRIYLTEQVTPLHAILRARHPHLVGSEFLGPDVPPGHTSPEGLRHEDLTRLSFADGSLDAILSFDVLEHIPDYRKALAECARVLAPGGAMLFSIPFMEDADETRTRARIGADGETVHDHPPMFHGDPMKPGEGVLCFHDFGWNILEAAREAGFADAAALAYRSPEFGYLGGWALVFTARKGAPG